MNRPPYKRFSLETLHHQRPLEFRYIRVIDKKKTNLHISKAGAMRVQVVSLLLLLVASPVLLDENLSRSSRYQKFKKQHINKQMKTGDCDSVITKNKINAKKNNKTICKPINTFILADESRVKSVCKKGKPQGKYMKSKAFFNLLACKLTNKKTDYPNCLYEGVELENKKIIIECDRKKLPVHYQGDIRYCDA